jgi:hypothetical protein
MLVYFENNDGWYIIKCTRQKWNHLKLEEGIFMVLKGIYVLNKLDITYLKAVFWRMESTISRQNLIFFEFFYLPENPFHSWYQKRFLTKILAWNCTLHPSKHSEKCGGRRRHDYIKMIKTLSSVTLTVEHVMTLVMSVEYWECDQLCVADDAKMESIV